MAYLSFVLVTIDWFNVKYDGEEHILTLNLSEDMRSGDLYLLQVDLVNTACYVLATNNTVNNTGLTFTPNYVWGEPE